MLSTQANKVILWELKSANVDVQGFFGYGYFVEDKELDAPNFLKTAERKKVLSNIESLGLLSAAEKAGLTLSKVLRLGTVILVLLLLHCEACMARHSRLLAQDRGVPYSLGCSYKHA